MSIDIVSIDYSVWSLVSLYHLSLTIHCMCSLSSSKNPIFITFCKFPLLKWGMVALLKAEGCFAQASKIRGFRLLRFTDICSGGVDRLQEGCRSTIATNYYWINKFECFSVRQKNFGALLLKIILKNDIFFTTIQTFCIVFCPFEYSLLINHKKYINFLKTKKK